MLRGDVEFTAYARLRLILAQRGILCIEFLDRLCVSILFNASNKPFKRLMTWHIP